MFQETTNESALNQQAIGSPNSPSDEDHLNHVISTWEDIISEHGGKDTPYSKEILSTSPRLDNEATDVLQQSSPRTNDINANIITEENQTDSQLDLERKNQLERRTKKKTRDKKKKKEETQQNAPALENLVSMSPMAEQIFEKLADLNVKDGNPLLGIRVLLRLSEDLQRTFYHLVHFPLLILENLLMIERISIAASLIKEFPELQENELIVTYAEKVLVFPVISPPILKKGFEWREKTFFKPSNSAKPKEGEPLVNVKERDFTIIWDYRGTSFEILTGDEQKDSQIRNRHYFTSGTPNIELALSILNLSKHKKISQNCIDICDDLSQQICTYDEEAYEIGSSIIEQLLQHAKKTIVEDSQENPQMINQRVALVNSYIDDNILLRDLEKSKCSCRLSLFDLTDRGKLRKLRDTLVQEDNMELAFRVCSQYHIEPEPLFVAWALSLLKKQNFAAAKEKLKFIFSSHRVSASYKATFANSVIQVLEMWPDEQKQEKGEFHFPQESFNQRFEMCCQYLSEYGSPQQLVYFLIVHRKFEEACHLIFSKKLSSNIFIHNVVLRSVRKNQLDLLRSALKKIDPTLSNGMPYLIAVCDFYSKKPDLKQLLSWQEFMNDISRAGLTCIKLFCETSSKNFEERQDFLRKAKEFFVQETKEIQGGKSPGFLTLSELNKYIRRLKIQEEISTFLEESIPKSDSEKLALKNLSVFGSNKQRCELCELILELGNYDLGAGIIVNFQLPGAAIFSNTVHKLVQLGQMKKVKPLLQRGKDIITISEQWDQFIFNCVKTFCDLNLQKKAEKFIEFMHNDTSKIDANVYCGKLKSAYLMAVKLNLRDKVVLIRDAAKAKNMMTEFRLCEKYLTLAEDTNVDD